MNNLKAWFRGRKYVSIEGRLADMLVLTLMAPEPEHPLTIFRALGLFQTGELDATLQKALLDSDVLIYCVPLGKRRIAVRRQMKDSADNLLAQLLFQAGASTTFWRHVWHMGVYGKAVTPAFRLFDVESWQRWELRTARELGLEVIRAAIADSPTGEADDIHLRPEALEADVRERVVPLMAGMKRPPPEPTGFLPIVALALLAWGILIRLAILVGISVAAFFLVRALF